MNSLTRGFASSLAALLLMGVSVASAQIMPAPRTAPHTPVSREALAERRAATARDVQGQAFVLDGEKLKIGEADIRLFGIVPPQLSASFGPQARATLDELMGGGQTVACHVRDRDRDGRLLATCRTANGADPALELLRRGLAVAARGSIAETELAQPYVSAEQAAQNAKTGLWSVVPPAAAVPVPQPAQPVAAPAPAVSTPAAPKIEAHAEAPKEAAKTADAKTNSVSYGAARADTHDDTGSPGLFARYQILIAGGLMLATALSILGALAVFRAREKRDEMKALAAALRGELLAARAVCLTRMKSIANEQDDRSTAWPRIRSTLYQAYVGRLGFLGAELARQVASIYGQASDYASYYTNLTDTAPVATPKKQALQILVAHIDEVLPRLAGIEQTGHRAAYPVYAAATPNTMPEVPVAVRAASVPVPAAETPAAPPTLENLETRLRTVVRALRERFVETRSTQTTYEHGADYASLIEEDVERFGLSSDDDDTNSISKIS